MRKPILIGGGLGLLLLLCIALAIWWGRGVPTPQPSTDVSADRPAVLKRDRDGAAPRSVSPETSAATPPSLSANAPSFGKLDARERHERLTNIRAELNTLRAEGSKASPEKMRALVDELEALSESRLDPEYFQTLRRIMDLNANIQALSAELRTLGTSNPARQRVIQDELRDLGQQMMTEAHKMQTYALKGGATGTP